MTEAKPPTRGPLLLIALLCLGSVSAALISQHVFDMQPCAWCVLQRLIYLLIAACALTGAACPAHRNRCIMLSSCLLLSLVGMVVAWYQYSVAAQMFSCDRTFADLFMTYAGLESAVPWLFGIYATCAQAAVTLLGIEYAVWSLMMFALLAMISLLKLRRVFQKETP